MKKLMTYCGFVAAFFSVLGMIFKIQHWPGAGPFLILGLGIFSFFFLPVFGYNLFYEFSDKKSKATAVSAGVLFVLIGLATIFKIMHWPGTAALLVLEFGIAGLFVFPLLMFSKMSSAKTSREKAIQVAWYCSLTLLLIGYCFKIMHWPYASILLSLGALILIIVYLPLATPFYNNDKDRNKLYQRYIIIPLILLFVLLSLSSNSNYDLFADLEAEIKLNTLISDRKNIERTQEFSKENDEQTKSYYSKILKVKELSDDLCAHIDDIKSMLIAHVDKVSFEQADTTESSDIQSKDNFAIPTEILIGSDPVSPKTGAYSAKELKAKIFVLQKTVIDMCAVEDKDHHFKVVGLNTDDIYKEDEQRKISWEEYHFDHIPLIAVITYLSLLQNNVRITESSAIESLYNGYVKNHDFKFNTRMERGDTLLLFKRKK